MDSIMLEQFRMLLEEKNEVNEKDYIKKQEMMIAFLKDGFNKCKIRYPFFDFHSKYEISFLAEKITERLMEQNRNLKIVDVIEKMKSQYQVIAVHSIRVAYLSMYTTQKIFEEEKKTLFTYGEHEKEKVITSGIAGLLHDIGKIDRGKKIMDVSQKTSSEEYQKYCEHVVNGHFFLKKNGIADEILAGVLQHHEMCNGEGFPLQLTGGQISNVGKIVAIADYFEHITENYKTSAEMEIFDITRKLKMQEKAIDMMYVNKLLDCLLKKIVGRRVTLSDETEAEIVQINFNNPFKSVVRVKGEIIELEKKIGVEIKKIL